MDDAPDVASEMPDEPARFKAGEYLGSAMEICMRLAFRHKRDFPELTFMSDAIGKAHAIVVDTERQIRLREVSAFLAGCRWSSGVDYDYELSKAQEAGDAALSFAGVNAFGEPETEPSPPTQPSGDKQP